MMRTAPLAVLLVLASGFTWGSPVSVAVDSKEKIEKIGAEITTKDFGEEIHVSISWKARFKTEDGYRLDLIIRDPEFARKPTPNKVQVICEPEQDGFCRTKFLISKKELKHGYLVFRGSWNHEYWLSIEALVAGFPSDPEPDSLFFFDPR